MGKVVAVMVVTIVLLPMLETDYLVNRAEAEWLWIDLVFQLKSKINCINFAIISSKFIYRMFREVIE